jgi:hypothetical protein
MKLLINDKEIAQFLSTLLNYNFVLKEIEINQVHTADALHWALEKKGNDVFIPKKYSAKAVEKITRGVKKDLEVFKKALVFYLKNQKKKDYMIIYKNIDNLIEQFGSQQILDLYKKSKCQNFVKSLGLIIDSDANLIRRKDFSDISEDCVIRNTVGNEKILIDKIDNDLPFWFIDSGYTNFIEPNKKWHRIVRNHLHAIRYFDAPTDRLKNFTCFPRPWRVSGEIILIIEPGPFSANIFHVDTKQWKIDIEKEIRKYTDKKIKFREKFPKKQRPVLYDELVNEDYYCVININSNAATESIWAGIPTITLDRHISNPVSRSLISDINDLYRGPLGNWLAYLSYNQFTYEEIVNGTAIEIIRKWHG